MIAELPEIIDDKKRNQPSDAIWRRGQSCDHLTLRDVDTVEGQVSDPMSLHKYLYCDAEPINGWDPSGHDDNSLADQAFDLADQVQQEDLSALQVIQGALGGNSIIGGPDITQELVGLGNFFVNSKSTIPALSLSTGLQWDIYPLPSWGMVGNSGADNTVTVGGKVFYPADVNYFLWGLWGKASGVDLSVLEDAVVVHRLLDYFGGPGPGGGSTMGRIAWTEVGYFYDGSGLDAFPTAIAGATPGTQYPNSMSFQVNEQQHNNWLSGTIATNGTVEPVFHH